MRIALIGCMVMYREICTLTAQSPNVIRNWWLRQGLHDTPDLLREELQRAVDEIEQENEKLHSNQRFEAIVLAYGLCSNGVLGLHSKSLPIIIPRCDDCISLFLGSAERYREMFREMPGTYWYNRGWIEQAFTPSKENYALRRQEFAEEYGEDNADYLLECTNSWMANYRYCGYITCPLGDSEAYRAYTRQAAEDFDWEYKEVEGDMSYFEALVNGPWEDERFLTCPPNHKVEADYSDRKFMAVPQ